MFRKLISNLPYSPSLLSNVGEYSSRLKQESHTRMLGLAGVAVATALSAYSIAVPTEPSVLSSPAHNLVSGGLSGDTAETLQQRILEELEAAPALSAALDLYQVSSEDLATTKLTTINTDNAAYRSVSRQSFARGAESCSLHLGEVLCERSLYASQKYNAKSMPALTGFRSNAQNLDDPWFAILVDSGNVVVRASESNKLSLHQQLTPGQAHEVKPGEPYAIQMVLEELDGKPASAPEVRYTLPDSVSLDDYYPKDIFSRIDEEENNVVIFTSKEESEGIGPMQSYILTLYLNSEANIEPGTNLCGLSVVTTQTTSSISHAPECTTTSGSLDDVICNEESCATYVPMSSLSQSVSLLASDDEFTTTSTYNVGADEAVRVELTTINNSDTPALLSPSIGVSDALQYMNITDTDGGTLNDQVKTLTWPETSIEPNGSLRKIITLRPLKPLPNTPTSASNPLSYDGRAELAFGNNLTLLPPVSAVKQIEDYISRLPVLSTRSSLLISGTLLGVVAYFYARNRLIVKELGIIRDEFTGGPR